MTTRLMQLVLATLLFPVYLGAQKSLQLDESLKANADEMKVKVGGHGFGKTWKIRFGDYAVVSSKMAPTKTNSKSNFLKTKSESKTSEKFSFELGNGPDHATVVAANNIDVQMMHEMALFPHVAWGRDEVSSRSNSFLAVINVNDDTTDTWELKLKSDHSVDVGNNFDGVLTNGTQVIKVSTVTSNKEGENDQYPALGYQLDDNGKYLGAVQFYGGGMLGGNKNIVWIRKDLDQKMKMLLGAAVTAILQIRITTPHM